MRTPFLTYQLAGPKSSAKYQAPNLCSNPFWISIILLRPALRSTALGGGRWKEVGDPPMAALCAGDLTVEVTTAPLRPAYRTTLRSLGTGVLPFQLVLRSALDIDSYSHSGHGFLTASSQSTCSIAPTSDLIWRRRCASLMATRLTLGSDDEATMEPSRSRAWIKTSIVRLIGSARSETRDESGCHAHTTQQGLLQSGQIV